MPRKSSLFSFRKPKFRITSKGLKITPPSARIGGKTGINISKSGVSGSMRTKHGTFNTKRGCSFHLLALLVAGAALFLPVHYGVGQTIPQPVYLPLISRAAPPTATPVPPTATNTPSPTSTTPPPATATPTNTPQPTATATSALLYICDRDAYNCSNFDTQSEAQAVFDYCVALNFGDIHKLDQNNDGVACESLP